MVFPGPSCGGSCGRRECPLMPLTLAWNPVLQPSSQCRSGESGPGASTTLSPDDPRETSSAGGGHTAERDGGARGWRECSGVAAAWAACGQSACGRKGQQPRLSRSMAGAMARVAELLSESPTPKSRWKAEDFGLDRTAARPPPTPPTSRDDCDPRAIAFPASNIAGAAISTFGVPGDIVRGVGALAGEKAATDLQGRSPPSRSCATPEPDTVPERHWVACCAPFRLANGQLRPCSRRNELAAAPGKQDVQPWMGNTPISSESLLEACPTLLG